MWEKGEIASDLGDLGSMQEFTCDKISVIESYGTVTDNRDNNKYKVAKLKDGKCWMVQNLRLGGDGLPSRTLTSVDSDVSSSYSLPSNSTSGFKFTQSNNQSLYALQQSNDSNEYGGWYTYETYTAGTGSSITNGSASGSICPRGWRLPTGGKDGEYEKLAKAYGADNDKETAATALLKGPVPHFALGGRLDGDNRGGPMFDQGTSATYGSSTASSSGGNYCLFINPSSDYHIMFSSDATDNRGWGKSVRCVARN